MAVVRGTKITGELINKCKDECNDDLGCNGCRCSEEECLQNLLDLLNKVVE